MTASTADLNTPGTARMQSASSPTADKGPRGILDGTGVLLPELEDGFKDSANSLERFFKSKVISGGDKLKKILCRDKHLYFRNFSIHSRPSSQPVIIKGRFLFSKKLCRF